MASTAPPPPPPDLDPPECPVCLSPYDAASAAPRVLPCGHSLCGPCIASLPPASASSSSASSLRCPLCSQCVPFSRALGPSSLPKNLALISLLPNPSPSLTNSAATAAVAAERRPRHLPLHADHSHLLFRFRHAILPETASPLHSPPPPGPGPEPTPVSGLAVGSFASDLGAPWFCPKGQPVSLLPVESPAIDGAPTKQETESSFYRPSHAARVVAAIDSLSGAAREEVIDLVDVSARLARRVCRVYGVWMGPEAAAAALWLVSERHSRGVSCLLERSRGDEMVARIRAVGMEMCEAFMGLHGEGLVLGCLGLDCFCLDHFGHCLLDLNQALALCRGVRAGVCSSKSKAFMAPEVAVVMHDKLQMKDYDLSGLLGPSSDAWLLGCLLVALVTGDEQLAAGWNTDGSYDDWKDEVFKRLDASLVDTQMEPLSAITVSCLHYDPEGRPEIADVWKCISSSLVHSNIEALTPNVDVAARKNFMCLLLAELSSMCTDFGAVEADDKMQSTQDSDDKFSTPDDESSGGFVNNEDVGAAGMEESKCGQPYNSSTLLAHHDCVTGLAIGGGFLFSSSYDKTINVWSLQTLKGHEHKITAIVVIDNDNQSLCISGDSGSGIFVWCVDYSLNKEPFNKWYESNDWIYRGVHCLAVSGTGYLYSGSRDKTIKAWSLEDYSLRCTMTGHKSTVSCLTVASGILYSGSWDGSIRSWWLTDHSPLSVLEDGTPGSIAPVLSISTEVNFVVASHENGFLKIWKDDVLVKSEKLHNGAIYAAKLNGKRLYTGGWDKVVYIQELLEDESAVEIGDVATFTCDSIITSILYWDGRLIVGLSNREIKA
uniref:RING-type domain-containing protein n=1 Tax=Leersia perrieri TaxID=77586 RepID=A0A0D9WGP3_9ORYZ